MRANDPFPKDVLCNVIKENLEILCQCINGTIYQQWTAVILLLQFIEYLLKYKIQSAGERFCYIHELKNLYCDLTDGDRNDIEERFSTLINNRKTERDTKSFDSIEEFARRYNTAYKYHWRYDIFDRSCNSEPEYFYLADTVTVLRALIESTDFEIDLPSIVNEDELAKKILKDGVRWGYVP